MPILGQTPILYDWSGAPVAATNAPITNRPATALKSPQGGMVYLGSDYATAANAQVPKVDAVGNQYAVPMVASVPVPVQVNTITTTPQSLYGSVSLAWSPANNQFVPFLVDASGSSVVRDAQAITAAYAPGTAISTTSSSGKSMFSIYNAGANYVRVLAIYMMCPVQAGTSSGLLTTSTYTTVGMGLAFFSTAHTGGTVIAPAVYDSRDTLDTAITCRTGATISGQASTMLRVFDAADCATMGYCHREDPSVKVVTLGPSQGMTCQCLTAVGSSGVSFYLTVVINQTTV